MAEASIPVDLFNPGQVFACMGFLEAADVLLGDAKGGFDWTNETEVRFELHAGGTASPVEAVLEFLIEARCKPLAPEGYEEPPHTKDEANELTFVATFPAPAHEADPLALPLRFEWNGHSLDVSHWCDKPSRNRFKLFAGQQRSDDIARKMLDAVRKLWNDQHQQLQADPFGVTVPLGGSSFKFDARKAWTAIEAGYSPDEQTHLVEASPVVEILAAIGLEHARPDEFEKRKVRYGAWKGLLPPVLARPALGGSRIGIPIRIFRFTLDLAGKNKIVTFAKEETYP